MAKNDFFCKKKFSHVYCAYFRPQTNFEPSVTSGSAGVRKNMRDPSLPDGFGIRFFMFFFELWNKS